MGWRCGERASISGRIHSSSFSLLPYLPCHVIPNSESKPCYMAASMVSHLAASQPKALSRASLLSRRTLKHMSWSCVQKHEQLHTPIPRGANKQVQ